MSLATHQVPAWFHDSKLGIFIHWGLFSVPGWAPVGGDIQAIIKQGGLRALMHANPYAEWYQNSLRIQGTPTWRHHQGRFGAGRAYETFQADFEREAEAMDPASWADLFARAGARYVVMVTKHHDGYLLWPSSSPNPVRSGFQSRRDFVGELTAAVRARGMRMGLYYSGVLDWTFQQRPVTDLATFILTQGQSAAYERYATGHWRELIERYRPAVLWNDIGYPYQADVPALMADYYNAVPEGVINDRWNQIRIGHGVLGKLAARIAAAAIERKTRAGHFEVPPTCHFDFRTPEYASYDEIRTDKWESCRGMGNSFGYNREETEEQMIRPGALIAMLVDIASKNGNLLLNVGPTADGTIPEMQQKPLLALGSWLSANGQAIYGTRPWVRPADKTAQGHEVRYTRGADALYATVLDHPAGQGEIALPVRDGGRITARLLDGGSTLTSTHDGTALRVSLPPGLASSPARVVALSPAPEA